jgi:hypothetical protein
MVPQDKITEALASPVTLAAAIAAAMVAFVATFGYNMVSEGTGVTSYADRSVESSSTECTLEKSHTYETEDGFEMYELDRVVKRNSVTRSSGE